MVQATQAGIARCWDLIEVLWGGEKQTMGGHCMAARNLKTLKLCTLKNTTQTDQY